MKSPLNKGASKLWLGSCVILASLIASVAGALATSEYQLKAVFLFNFAQFVEWPEAAFDDATDELKICVLGEDPFGTELEAVMEGERIGGRPIGIERVPAGETAAHCHLVYVNQNAESDLRQTLQALNGKPVLTVGETEAFTASGGIIRFFTEDNKVRLRINPRAAEQSHLRLSSKLLRSSQIVAKENGSAP